jgi:hypothetical protein
MGDQVLLQKQMKKRGETSVSFIKMITDKGRRFLGNITTV